MDQSPFDSSTCSQTQSSQYAGVALRPPSSPLLVSLIEGLSGPFQTAVKALIRGKKDVECVDDVLLLPISEVQRITGLPSEQVFFLSFPFLSFVSLCFISFRFPFPCFFCVIFPYIMCRSRF